MCWSITHIQMCCYFMHCYVAIVLDDGFPAAVASGVATRCAWPGRGESATELTPFRNFLVHSYTCCSDKHASPYCTSILRWISVGLTPSLLKKQWHNADPLWCMLKVGPPFYTAAAPLCCIPPLYCHLSATLQTMSNTVANLQENWAVFRFFVALFKVFIWTPYVLVVYNVSELAGCVVA
jgi:hypothetical protein